MALINDIYVFVKTETLTRETDVSSHTLPTVSITDNVRLKRQKLELSGSIVDVEETKADTILSALEILYINKAIITYQGRHTFYSALIKSFETKADANNAGGYSFEIELEETRTAAKQFSDNSTGTAQITSNNKTKYHIVKSGDTLYSIAQQYYGNSNRFIDIYNANKDKIKSDYVLAVGIALKIP